MKLSRVVHIVIATCLLALASPAMADLNSLRGAQDLPVTLEAPKLLKFINDKENFERTFDEQPPLVPHKNEKYSINLTTNKCLECHMKEEGKDEAKSVEMSESHYIDRAGKKHDKPVGARHFCTQCHVPQVDAPPLVGTDFQAAR